MPPHFRETSFSQCCGRTYDLKRAYKQFPICSNDRELLRVLVCEPGVSNPRVYGFDALPFRAVGSVAAFLRVNMEPPKPNDTP